MNSTEEQLARIGFGKRHSEPACWRAARLDEPIGRERCRPREPACSRALLRWRDLLAERPLPPFYRISRA